MIALLAAVAAGAAVPCDLDAPSDAPFRHPLPPAAAEVLVVVEVHAATGDPALAHAVLAALAERGRPGTLVLPLPALGDALAEPLVALGVDAALAGHEVAVAVPGAQVSQDPYSLDGPMRRRRSAVADAVDSKVRSVVSSAWGAVPESHLSRAGFRAILTTAGPATAVPRLGMAFEGQPRVSAVLMSGPWSGPCGRAYDLGPFTPVAADRAAQAIHGAARSGGTRVVRIGLDDVGSVDEAAVLGRWIDEVLAPAGVDIVSASEAHAVAMRALRRPGVLAVAPEPETLGGRLVPVADLLLAAQALATADAIPRRLPGEMTPTEAFLGFATYLAGRAEGESVRLGALAGPRTGAPPTIDAPTPVEKGALVAVITRVVEAGPAEVPAALPVGDRMWTAAEILTAMASAIRGEDPPMARPLASPDPDAAGQGWSPVDAP